MSLYSQGGSNLQFSNNNQCCKLFEPGALLIKLFFTLLLIFAPCACSSHLDDAPGQFSTMTARNSPPRSVAILPFENRTDDEDIEHLVREGFYSQLCPKRFKDVELSIVDERLAAVNASQYESFRTIEVQELGRLLDCDALVYGAVTKCKRLFVGIYSQMCVGLSITVYDTRSGERVWADDEVTCFHEGGVPLGLLDIPMATVRSGMNMRKIVKVRAVDELCRILTARIPEIGEESGTASLQAVFELQVGAFLEKPRAVEMLVGLRQEGYPAFIRRHQEGSSNWHRVIIGPYERRDEAGEILEQVRASTAPDAFVRDISVSTAGQVTVERLEGGSQAP